MLGFFNAKVRFAYVGIPRIKRASSYQVKTERLSNIAYDFLDKLEIRCFMQRYSSEQALYSPFFHEYAGLFWKMIDCWHLVSLDVKKVMAIAANDLS